VSGSSLENKMPIKKTDSRMEAGVKLTLVEEVMPMGKVRSQLL